MELRHLRYFVAVAEELSFSRAATRLGTSQPPLSRQVRDLEEELGHPLFHRHHQRIELTAAGKVFLEQARDLLQRAQGAVASARRAARGETGTLRINHAAGIAHHLLAAKLAAMRTRCPEVRIDLLEMPGMAQREALVKGGIDLAFAPMFVVHRDRVLAHRPVARHAHFVVLPPTHPLGRQRTLRLADLAQESFVSLSREDFPFYETWLATMCRRAGFAASFPQAAGQFRALLMLVAAGYGVGIVPEPFRRAGPPGLLWRPLRPELKITFSAIWRRSNQSPALASLLQMIPRLR